MSQVSQSLKPALSHGKSVQIGQDQGRSASSETVFSSLSQDIQLTQSILASLPSNQIESISKSILKHICQKVIDSSFDENLVDTSFIDLQKSLKLSELKSDFGQIYTTYYSIIRTILRTKIPQSKARSCLLEMNLPSATVDAIIKATVTLRTDKLLLSKFHRNIECRWPSISKLKWRIDVVISSGSLGRVMRPHILMKFILSDGRMRTVTVSLEQFHQLRHSVAKLLYDMQSLERHPIMRIVNEVRVKEIEDLTK